jgi:hypothetical protein
MKKLILIICGVISVMTIFSCNDVLNQIPMDRYTDATVYNDQTLMDAYLAELYKYTPVLVQDASCTWNWGQGNNIDYPDWKNHLNQGAETYGIGLPIQISDEARATGGCSETYAAKLHGITQNGGTWEYWGTAYYVIRDLNEFIQKGEKSTISKSAIRVAEARFLRAFNYFAMVKRYGGVPLITEPTPLDADSSVMYPKRNSEKEIYDFILKEMDEISKILPGTEQEYGRANKWAALALRARAALYAGSIAQFGTVQLDGLLGIPKNESQNYYKICYDACNEIISSGAYKLYNEKSNKAANYKALFMTKKNCETILAVQHSGQLQTDNCWSWDVAECPSPQCWGLGNQDAPYFEFIKQFENIDGTSRNNIWNNLGNKEWTMDELWKNIDPRFYGSCYTNGTPFKGCSAGAGVYKSDTIDFHLGIIAPNGTLLTGANDSYDKIAAIGNQPYNYYNMGINVTGFGVNKYLDENANNGVWLLYSNSTDYMVIRYAEILLNYAESAFELGKTGDALDAVNQIRERAGIAKLASVDEEKIRHERRIELAFENHRYWDLRRWRTAEKELTRSFSGLQYIYDIASKKYKIQVNDRIDGQNVDPHFDAREYYFPITPSRIQANPNLVENPGY